MKNCYFSPVIIITTTGNQLLPATFQLSDGTQSIISPQGLEFKNEKHQTRTTKVNYMKNGYILGNKSFVNDKPMYDEIKHSFGDEWRKLANFTSKMYIVVPVQ